MKDFFSEFGWIVANAVLIGIVIMMQTPLGEMLQNSITNIINNFTSKIPTGVGA